MSAFVIFLQYVARKPQARKNASRNPALPLSRHFLARGETALAVVSIKPDSLRRPMRRERHQVCGHRVPSWLKAFAEILPRRKFRSMLPGFRFLFAAIVMCMSVLVFGLGAAALFRAAHEDFASNPTWRAPPEPRFAQQDEATKTVLAVLSVQPPVTEPPAAQTAADAAATTAAPATASPESRTPEPQATAALSPAESASPSEAARPATSAAEVAPAQPSSQVETAAPSTPAEAQADAPAPASATKIAVTEERQAAPPGQTPPSASEPALSAPQSIPEPVAALATPQSAEAATKIATLGGPPVITEEIAAARASDAKLDRSEINKRLRAEHAKEQQRRRLAARRERLAQQAAAAQLEAANPFAPHPLVGNAPASASAR
jgi:hypothetical protein